VNPATEYSYPCRPVNTIASTTVRTRPSRAADRPRLNRAWWLYVTVAPLLTSSRVLSRGIARGDRAVTPAGGHCVPSSTVGASDEWKSFD